MGFLSFLKGVKTMITAGIEKVIASVVKNGEADTIKIINSLKKDIANFNKTLASKNQDLADAQKTLAKITAMKNIIIPPAPTSTAQPAGTQVQGS